MVEGGHRTQLKDQINCCVLGVPPAPVYKGARGEVRPARRMRIKRSPTPIGSRTPSLPCWIRRRGKEEGERKERGIPPPLLVLFGLEGEGRLALP